MRKTRSRLPDRCGSCRRCLDALPYRRSDSSYQMDATMCISYLTIEHRGRSPKSDEGIGRQVFGCDICQDVCPWEPESAGDRRPRVGGAPGVGESGAGRSGAIWTRRSLSSNSTARRCAEQGFWGLRRNVAIAWETAGRGRFAPLVGGMDRGHGRGPARGGRRWAMGDILEETPTRAGAHVSALEPQQILSSREEVARGSRFRTPMRERCGDRGPQSRL